MHFLFFSTVFSFLFSPASACAIASIISRLALFMLSECNYPIICVKNCYYYYYYLFSLPSIYLFIYCFQTVYYTVPSDKKEICYVSLYRRKKKNRHTLAVLTVCAYIDKGLARMRLCYSDFK